MVQENRNISSKLIFSGKWLVNAGLKNPWQAISQLLIVARRQHHGKLIQHDIMEGMQTR